MDDFMKAQGDNLAGYVMPFLLCPLDPSFPSAFIPVGLVPTDLRYTSLDLARYLQQIS